MVFPYMINVAKRILILSPNQFYLYGVALQQQSPQGSFYCKVMTLQ